MFFFCCISSLIQKKLINFVALMIFYKKKNRKQNEKSVNLIQTKEQFQIVAHEHCDLLFILQIIYIINELFMFEPLNFRNFHYV